MKKIYFGLFATLISLHFSCKKTEDISSTGKKRNDDRSSLKTEKESDLYYWSGGKKISITIDSTAAIFLTNDTNSAISTLKKSYQGAIFRKLNSDYVLIKSTGKIDLGSIKEDYTNIQHIFKISSHDQLIPTGELVLQPNTGHDISSILRRTSAKLKIKKKSKYNTFLIKIEDNSSVLDVANLLYESGLVKYCHPNFIAKIERSSIDPLFSSQYYLKNTGQFAGIPGIDVNINDWSVTDGFQCGIKVAVLDDGVEAHEDLSGRLLSGYTALHPLGYGAPLTSGNTHGQACAGIIAASKDNSLGIAGVAPKASIIPVNIMDPNATTDDIVDAIDWAWDLGDADILSNSWQYTYYTYFSDIDAAFTRARTLGRNGKGCIVIASSGNYNLAFGMTFPGTIPGVVTVGAIDKAGSIWPYSGSGPELELVAPVGNAGAGGDMVTTDRMGVNGSVTGNYLYNFGGTSGSCPQVSGAAALILSINPDLTESQVVNILNSTATDMGSSGYDINFGNGRLNVSAASAKAAKETFPIIGLSTICNVEQNNYSVTLPAGASISWDGQPYLRIIGSNTSSTVTVKSNSFYSGVKFLSATITLPGCGSVKTSISLNATSPCSPLPPPIVSGVDYLGRVTDGDRIYFFYGNSATQVITAGVIIDLNKQFVVTHFINAKITINGLTGRMYATDENGSQYTFVLSGMELELELLD